MMPLCSLSGFCCLFTNRSTKALKDKNVQDYRLFKKWGAIPQQYHSSASQKTEHFDDLLYHQVPVALQTLLNMAEA